MIHGSSDLKFRLRVTELILTRMSHHRERRSLQLSEKTPLLLQKEVYSIGPTSLSDTDREASVSADFC